MPFSVNDPGHVAEHNTINTIKAASGVGYVNHGAVAGTARPTGYACVIWFGTVEPTNADTTNDTWVDTT